MQSAESEQALIRQFKGQLALSNIEILDQSRFTEFWDMVFLQKRMTFTTQTMIQQFISPANHDRFYKFAEEKSKELFHKPSQEGNIKLQENIMDDGRQQGAHNSMKKMKKQVDLSYDPSNCLKNILILIISLKQIKKTVLLCSGQDVDIECQTLNYQDSSIYGRCILVPLNFKMLPISSYSIQIDIKTVFDWILKSQTNVYELEQKVEYHLGKGIVKINNVSGNIDNFLKKFLLKIAQFLFKIEYPKGQWTQLKPWWYLLKSIYPADKLQPESDSIDSLKLDTKDVQFYKYFLWLLKAIYGSELDQIKNNSQCFKQIKFSENYEFPINLSQELQMIELEYLRCLMLSKNPIKAKMALQWNLLYQPQELKSQILMNLSSKLMQELSEKVEPLFIDNRFITIKQFVEKYFSQLITIVDYMTSQPQEREENAKKQKQRQGSALIIDDFKILLKKCKAIQKNVVEIELNNQSDHFYWNKFNQILFASNPNGSPQLRLIVDHLPTFIELSNEFSPLQPKIAKIMLDAFNFNDFSIKKFFDASFKRMLIAIENSAHEKLLELLKKYILVNEQKHIENIKNVLEHSSIDGVKIIGNFVLKIFPQLSPFHQNILIAKLQQRVEEDQSLIDIIEKLKPLIPRREIVVEPQRVAERNSESLLQPKPELTQPKPELQPQPIPHQSPPSKPQLYEPFPHSNKKPEPYYYDVDNPSDNEIDIKPRPQSQKIKIQASQQNNIFQHKNVDKQVQPQPINQQKSQVISQPFYNFSNQKNIEVLFVIMSSSKNVLKLIDKHKKQEVRSTKNQRFLYQGCAVTIVFCQKFNSNKIDSKLICCINQKGEEYVIQPASLNLDEDECCGLIKINQEEFKDNIKAYIQIKILNFLCKKFERKMETLRHWIKLYKKSFAYKHKEYFVQELNVFMTRDPKQAQTFEFYYSLLKIMNFLFQSKALEVLTSKSNFLNSLNSIRIGAYNFQRWVQQEQEQVQIFKMMCKINIELLLQNKISISVAAKLLKNALQITNNRLGKELIHYSMTKKLPKLVTELDLNLQVTNYCNMSHFIYFLELFYVKCFYMTEICKKDNPIQFMINLFNAVNDKYNQQKERRGLKIDAAEQLIISLPSRSIQTDFHQVLFQKQVVVNRFYSQNESNFQDKQSFFKNNKDLFQMYKHVKLIEAESVYDIVYGILKKAFQQKMMKNLCEFEQFQKTIQLLLMNPIRSEDNDIINDFLRKQMFRPQMLVELLKIYSKWQQKSVNPEMVKQILLKMISKHPENAYDQHDFLMQLDKVVQETEEQNKKEMQLLLEKLFSSIIIRKVSSYIQSAVFITNLDLKRIYITSICTQLLYHDKLKQSDEIKIYDYCHEAFQGSQQNDKKVQQVKRMFIEIYFERNRHLMGRFKDQVEQIWDFMLNKPQYLEYIQYKYRRQFPGLMKEVYQKVEEKQYLGKQLLTIYNNFQFIPKSMKNTKAFLQLKDQGDCLIKNLDSIKNLYAIFEQLSGLKNQQQKIQNIHRNYQSLKIKDIFSTLEKYKEVCLENHQIKILMRLKTFKLEHVTNIESLMSQYHKTREIVLEKLKNVKTIMFRQFLDFFASISEEILSTLCSQLDKSQKIWVIECVKAFKKENLRLILQTMNGLVYLKKKCSIKALLPNEKEEELISDLKLIIEEIEDQNDRNSSADKYFHKILDIEDYLMKEIDKKWAVDIKGVIIRCIYRYQELFEKMDQAQLTLQKFKNLIDYSNELQNSIAKVDIIRQLRSVFLYWDQIKKCKTIKDIMKKTKTLIIEQSKWFSQLAKSIQNCHANISLLFQKLEEASDRSKSFKFQVKAILQASFLHIIFNDGDIQIKVQVIRQENKEEYISFKKLNLFYDKSVLIQPNENENQSEEDLNITKLLETYKLFFIEVNGIYQQCLQLVNYGYNPQLFVKKIEIRDQHFQEIIDLRVDLRKITKQWVEQIKKIYANSFVLTHFIGINLVNFIQTIEREEYYPGLQNILDIDEKQFENLLKQPKNAKQLATLQGGFLDSIERVIIIQQIFSFYDEKRITGRKKIPKKIKLVTSNPKFFYSCILKENESKIPLPNQVLMCHENTKPQELQFFLYRALIDWSKCYFIVGIHKVDEKVKNNLCFLLGDLNERRNEALKSCQLVFIDNDDKNTVYYYLSRPKVFEIEKNLNYQNSFTEEAEKYDKFLINQLSPTLIISSVKAGLGKTYQIQKIGRQQGQAVYHFPIGGNISFKSLSKRLKRLSFKGKEILLIKIGSVLNKTQLQLFLSSLIIFRCFFSEEYIFLDKSTKIFIQIQNIYTPSDFQRESIVNEEESHISSQYHILNILKKHGQQRRIELFNSKQIDFPLELNYQEQFVFLYFDLLDKKLINSHNILYENIQTYEPLSKERKHALIEMYYSEKVRSRKLEPTYAQYKNVMKALFLMFDTFSKIPGLSAQLLEKQNEFRQEMAIKFDFLDYRRHFIEICMENIMKLLEQTFTENKFKGMATDQRTFKEMSKNIPLLIIPDCMNESYHFVYLDDKLLPKQIKYYNLIQSPKTYNLLRQGPNLNFDTIFTQHLSYSSKKDDELANLMLDVLRATTVDQRYLMISEQEQKKKQQLYKNYVLTRDNFFKMCLIIQRERSGIPCVIQGESGVGKTALIRFLAQFIYNTNLLVFNINAGIHQNELKEMVKKATDLAQEDAKSGKKLWVFFDEFNTTDQLTYIKEILVEKKFMGQNLPENIYFIAACNPYRLKRSDSSSGRNGNGLAFRVNPPPLSMIQMMWDYQQLTKQENKLYMKRILASVKYTYLNELIGVMIQLHEKTKEIVEISAVSLRDVERFKELYAWFTDYLIKAQRDKYFGSKENIQNRAVALALMFCYCLRFSYRKERKNMMNIIENGMKWPQKYMHRVIEEEQTNFVEHLNMPAEGIALNTALKENTFTTFVCIMNKIPILIIGTPGSSKSLSVRILNSNLNGKASNVQICKKYPQINMIYFQGSESSTSEGVEEVFNKVDTIKYSDKSFCQNCIYFDEIGLAEASIHNPLKVLHCKLEIHNEKKVAFIGISNVELDAAKMSRCLVLNRPPPEEQELKQTARLIYNQQAQKNYNIRYSNPMEKSIQKIGLYYYKFIQEWDSKSQNRKGFFGLRDFYNCVKYVCSALLKDIHRNFQEKLNEAININFDGQANSLSLFKRIIRKQNQKSPYFSENNKNWLDPIQLVQKNIQNSGSRCLLLIVKGETLLPIITERIAKKRSVVVIYGSAFVSDERSEQYNLEVTNRVIASMKMGQIVAFKDINNSIQSSLYDLFNKSYILSGTQKLCRIAVGANSLPQCPVDQKFNAIVFVDEIKIQRGELDLPFLNRFQKHFLLSESILKDKEPIFVKMTKNWIEKILQKTKNTALSPQNYLFNISDQSIITLVLKYRECSHEQKLNYIKRDILHNRTLDFGFFFYYNKDCNQLRKQFEQLPIENPIKDKNDLIIYTYDQFVHLDDNNQGELLSNCSKIRISEIKSQKQLKQKIEDSLKSQQHSKCAIVLNYEKQNHLIQQILFQAHKVKTELKLKGQIIVIIQFHRFSFVQNPERTLNISYLHPFNQYFIQRLDFETSRELQKAHNYKDLFYLFNFASKLESLFVQAVSLMKIKVVGGGSDPKAIFARVSRLCTDNEFNKNLMNFLDTALANQQINYELIQINKKEIMFQSTTLEALENLVNEITVKHIFIFTQLVIYGDYIDIFEDKMDIEGSPILADKEKLIKMNKFLQEIQEQVKTIQNNIERELKRIKYEKEANEVINEKSLFTFKEIGKFIEQINQKIKDQEILQRSIQMEAQNEIKCISYSTFKQIVENVIISYPSIETAYKSRDTRAFILKDIIAYKFKNRSERQRNILQVLFIDIVQSKTDLIKMNILFSSNSNNLDIFLDILAVVVKYCTKSRYLLDGFDQSLSFSEVETPNESTKKLVKELIAKGVEWLEGSEQIIDKVMGVNNFYAYFKEFNNKITQFSNYIQDICPSHYILLKNFLELLESVEPLSKEKIIIDFMQFERKRSIYERIYSFTKILIDEDLDNEKKYKTFLSIRFFQSWHSDLLKNNGDIDSCVSAFAGWCNNSVEFANKSYKFFDSFFKGQPFQTIEEADQSLRTSIKSQIISSFFGGVNFLQVALGNYFVKKIIEIISVIKSPHKTMLEEFLELFERWIGSQSILSKINEHFRRSFLKIYLTEYLNRLMKGEDSVTVQKIDKCLNQEGSMRPDARLFLVNTIKKSQSVKEIKRNFFEIRRCEWIKKVKSIIDRQYSLQQQMQDQQISFKKNYLLKPITFYAEDVFGDQAQKILQYAISKDISRSYPFIHYCIKATMPDYPINTMTLLEYLKRILLFLSKIKKMCHLKIRRHELSISIQQFIQENIESSAQKQQFLEQLKKYIEIIEYFRLNWREFDSIFDCQIFKKIPNFSQSSRLSIFLLFPTKKELEIKDNDFIASFISKIAEMYNQICNDLKRQIEQTKENSIVITSKTKEVDPFSLSPSDNLLSFPDIEFIKNIVAMFSGYSVQQNDSEFQFFFEDIQTRILNLFTPFSLIKTHKSQFSQIEFTGQITHFLIQLKQNYKTLKEINKLENIQDYFKGEKDRKKETFHKKVKKLLKSLEILIIYYKNTADKENIRTVEDLYENYQIKNIPNEFKENIFKTLPTAVLADLYQYVEALNFDHIKNLVSEHYKTEKLRQEQKKLFDEAVDNMKKGKIGYPSYDSFKKALYRFVYRNVLSQTVNLRQTIKDYLCHFSYYWDKEAEPIFQELSRSFTDSLRIEMSQLMHILQKLPFQQIAIPSQTRPTAPRKSISKNYW